MITACVHHAQCGLPSLSSSPLTTRRRSGIPRAIQCITNIPTYSTTNPSLTSFLRFPPEIRTQIYRLLLTSNHTIEYGICPVKERLVSRERPDWLGEMRHGLFPSILECCRKINQEGRMVLYGENWFQMEHSDKNDRVLETWGPGRSNLDSITRLSLTYCSWFECEYDRRVLYMLELLPGIKELRIHLEDFLAQEWDMFLAMATDRLASRKKITLEVGISQRANSRTGRREWPAFRGTVRDKCLWTYEQPFKKHKGLWGSRKVKWEFEECTDRVELAYGMLGTVRVTLE